MILKMKMRLHFNKINEIQILSKCSKCKITTDALWLDSLVRSQEGCTNRHLIFLLGGKTISDNINSAECVLSGTAANHLVHTAS